MLLRFNLLDTLKEQETNVPICSTCPACQVFSGPSRHNQITHLLILNRVYPRAVLYRMVGPRYEPCF